MPRWLYFLLIFSLLSILLDLLQAPPLLVFIVAALGIVPLASMIGTAVEDVAEHTGEKIGGLLFATFGNATELIIGILSLTKGTKELIAVVSASIIGSILGNALLVLGISVLIGGFKHGRQHFDSRLASQYASLLALSVGGLLLPTMAELLASRTSQPQIFERGVALSDFIAVLLLIGYIASILFSVFHLGDRSEAENERSNWIVGPRSMPAIIRLLTYRQSIAASDMPGRTSVLNHIDNALGAIAAGSQQIHNSQEAEKKNEPLWRGLLLLIVATVGVAILSEILVGTIEPMTQALHWNPGFVGLVFIPLIGGLPEYFNTISMALDKRMGMVLAASAGSSIQIALLIAPVLVLVSLFTPYRLDLVFSLVELGVLGLATFLFSEITKDGELAWLEGLLLVLLYAMMGGTVFLFGS